MPEAPIGFDESTPPEQLTGSLPSIAVSPDSVSRQPPPFGSAKPSDSSHIGSNHENGTEISAASISSIGLVMPACFQSAAAAAREAGGVTWSRSAADVASERITVPWIQAGFGEPEATSSAAMTRAQAPSEDGQVSS